MYVNVHVYCKVSDLKIGDINKSGVRKRKKMKQLRVEIKKRAEGGEKKQIEAFRKIGIRSEEKKYAKKKKKRRKLFSRVSRLRWQK